MNIGEGRSELGSRLGGRAPDGVAPGATGLTYFFTVDSPYVQECQYSVFVDTSEEFIFGGNEGKILVGPGIEVIEHPAAQRAKSRRAFDSPISEHPLNAGEYELDMESEDGELRPYSSHKMGGRPYFVRGEPALEDRVASLLEVGYRQLVQIDFPGGEHDADVSGAWPIGTALFHVMISLRHGASKWACFWEQ